MTTTPRTPNFDAVGRFCARLWMLLDEYPGSVTSWLRSPAHHKAVGGLTNSLHLEGLAADIVLDNKTTMSAAAVYARSLGLYALNEGTHLHVELHERPRHAKH
jgi:uncharacterized protein YcbK (DUF882 family)